MTRDINTWVYDGEGGMIDNYDKNSPLWTETTETVYNEQLDCLPPIRQGSYAFMVGECYDRRDKQNQYAAFVMVEINKKRRFFGKILSVNMFSPFDYKAEILNQLSRL
jgi:hypothetical protein